MHPETNSMDTLTGAPNSDGLTSPTGYQSSNINSNRPPILHANATGGYNAASGGSGNNMYYSKNHHGNSNGVGNNHNHMGEEISTIFVVGFPDDMQEREFQNMFIFSPGFEAATLKIPQEEDMNGKKQIIGFAKFRTRIEAMEARDILTGRKVDFDRGCILKAEMAKKNLHVKKSASNSLHNGTLHYHYPMHPYGGNVHSPSSPNSLYQQQAAIQMNNLLQYQNQNYSQSASNNSKSPSGAQSGAVTAAQRMLGNMLGNAHLPSDLLQANGNPNNPASAAFRSASFSGPDAGSFVMGLNPLRTNKNRSASFSGVSQNGNVNPTQMHPGQQAPPGYYGNNAQQKYSGVPQSRFQNVISPISAPVSQSTSPQPQMTNITSPGGSSFFDMNDLRQQLRNVDVSYGGKRMSNSPTRTSMTPHGLVTLHESDFEHKIDTCKDGPEKFNKAVSRGGPMSSISSSISLSFLDRNATTFATPPSSTNASPTPSNTLYIGNLPVMCSEKDLLSLFQGQPGFRKLFLQSRADAEGSNACFVEFETVHAAALAMELIFSQPTDCANSMPSPPTSENSSPIPAGTDASLGGRFPTNCIDFSLLNSTSLAREKLSNPNFNASLFPSNLFSIPFSSKQNFIYGNHSEEYVDSNNDSNLEEQAEPPINIATLINEA